MTSTSIIVRFIATWGGRDHLRSSTPIRWPGWNPCKPHAEDAPRLSKYHAKVFGMTPQKPKTKQNTPSTSTIYAGTRQNLRSHASTPRISKLHAEDLRRDIHRFHPGKVVDLTITTLCNKNCNFSFQVQQHYTHY